MRSCCTESSTWRVDSGLLPGVQTVLLGCCNCYTIPSVCSFYFKPLRGPRTFNLKASLYRCVFNDPDRLSSFLFSSTPSMAKSLLILICVSLTVCQHVLPITLSLSGGIFSPHAVFSFPLSTLSHFHPLSLALSFHLPSLCLLPGPTSHVWVLGLRRSPSENLKCLTEGRNFN